RRETTILLTSHYMKDVAALCRRVVIVAGGRVEYDGSLSGIIDTFSGHKVVTFLFANGSWPDDLQRYGEVLDLAPPKARLRITRSRVAEVLSHLLAQHSIEDISVEDPPLEEVIADAFSRVGREPDERDEGKLGGVGVTAQGDDR
ncbi:MAG: hypothetical protein KDA99_22175, partial [Planctomycetales bacterium]|nr:hypothetical protein [Planctomycetales bacterium]